MHKLCWQPYFCFAEDVPSPLFSEHHAAQSVSLSQVRICQHALQAWPALLFVTVSCPIVRTILDCHLTFLRCLQFEESLISHKMAQMGDESEDETPDNEEDDGKGFLLSDDGKDIDLRYDAGVSTAASLSVQQMYAQLLQSSASDKKQEVRQQGQRKVLVCCKLISCQANHCQANHCQAVMRRHFAFALTQLWA